MQHWTIMKGWETNVMQCYKRDTASMRTGHDDRKLMVYWRLTNRVVSASLDGGIGTEYCIEKVPESIRVGDSAIS